MVGHCKDCKSWFNQDRFETGKCKMVAEDSRWMRKDSMAFNGCAHDGDIITGKDFGCIHFVEKEVDNTPKSIYETIGSLYLKGEEHAEEDSTT